MYLHSCTYIDGAFFFFFFFFCGLMLYEEIKHEFYDGYTQEISMKFIL